MSKITVAILEQRLNSALERIDALEARLNVAQRRTRKPAPTLEGLAKEGAKHERFTKRWANCAAQWLALKNQQTYQAIEDGGKWIAVTAKEANERKRQAAAAKRAAAQS